MKKKHLARVRYMDQISQIQLDPKKSILDSLVANKIPIGRSCNGEGICTTCRIILAKGSLSPQTDLEKMRSEERNFTPKERLACQANPEGVEELHIIIP